MKQGVVLELGDIRVERDRYCWMFQRRMVSKKTGKPRWENQGYYGTLEGLAKRLLSEEVGLQLDVELLKYGEALDQAADRLASVWKGSK